ncbi:MAG TPA: ABC transporter substrate-binding protein [Gaiellaceae bacterium]|nr:ABC transporter substrate-binding protein [Gaiellaceae bacterium]
MHLRKRLWHLVVLGLAGLALAAVAATAASSKPLASKASTIIDGTTDTVTNIDPAGNYDEGTSVVDLMIYQHLLGYPQGKKVPSPELATGCKANGADTVWTCTLKKGVKFSNGDPFTSADVKWSFDRVIKIKDPSGISGLLANLKSTTTNGPYSVSFHTKTPDATWPYILTTGAGLIVDHKIYPANKIVPDSNVSDLIGTGPYKLTKFSSGQQAVFSVNSNYSGPKPKNDGVIITYYSKSSTMKLALTQGSIDMAFRDFTATEYGALGKTKGITVYQGPGVSIRYLVFNVKRAPTNNLAVRQAIAYLMPRQDIATRIYHGEVQPLYSMVPKGLPGHEDSFATQYGDSPNPAKAKQVLSKAGVKTPIPLTIWWTPTHYGDSSADEYSEIQRALNSSGLFKVTLKSAEWATYVDTLGKQYTAYQLGWFPDYVDGEDYLLPFYLTGNFTSNAYSNPQMDSILKKEQGAKSTPERLGYIEQAQALAAKDVPIVPVWQGAMLAVGRSNIHGIQQTLDPTYIMRFWNLSKS